MNIMGERMTKWYVVHANAKSEGMAAGWLKEQGYEVLWLHYEGKTTHARKVKDVLRSYYPRYLYVGISPEQSFYAVNKTPGVSTIVYAGDQPLEIPSEVMADEFAKAVTAKGLVPMSQKQLKERRAFRANERVRIMAGPFAGFFAVVHLDKTSKVAVWLDAFAGKVEAEVAPQHLQSASPDRRRVPEFAAE